MAKNPNAPVHLRLQTQDAGNGRQTHLMMCENCGSWSECFCPLLPAEVQADWQAFVRRHLDCELTYPVYPEYKPKIPKSAFPG